MIVKCFGCTTIHNKVLYNCIIHSFIHAFVLFWYIPPFSSLYYSEQCLKHCIASSSHVIDLKVWSHYTLHFNGFCLFWCEIRVAKRNYSDELRIQLSSSDSASVWKVMKDITSYKTPSPSTVENQQQVDNLTEFCCRFEKTPHTRPEHLFTQPLVPPATPLSPTPAIRSAKTRCTRSSGSRKGKKHQAQTVLHQSVWNPVLTKWPPSSQRY